MSKMSVNAKASASLRIIWAIATKDILEALKNRVLISLVVAMVFMMFSAQALPLLLKLGGATTVIIFEPGGSRLTEALQDNSLYRVVEARSRQEMEKLLVEASEEALAIAVPAAGESLELNGYITWANRTKATTLKTDLENHLTEQMGQPVWIHVEGNIVFPPPEGTRSQKMTASVMVIILMTLGTFLIPHLMFEEKQAHTMEVLLVSPASYSQVVMGKALAGLFYCLVGMAVVLAFNYHLIAWWGAAVLAVLCGAVLFIALGLVLGTVFETPQQMSGFVVIPFLILMLPTLLGMLGTLPEPFAALAGWLPTMALSRVFLASFSNSTSWAQVLLDLALVLVWAIPVYAAVIWLLRRSDR
jgi:ABC-2 type transport system permease protein